MIYILYMIPGFSLLFCLLIPVPRELKIGFHVFGVASLIVGLIQTVYTFQAEEFCVSIALDCFITGHFSLYSR